MRRFALLLLIPLLVLAACGSDDGGDDDGASSIVATGDPATLDGVTVDGAADAAPTVTFEMPFTIDDTARKVLAEGDGETVESGAQVVVDYLVVNGRDGSEILNSFGTGAQSIVLNHEVLPALVKGLVGTTVGSRVLVAADPDDAWGPNGGLTDLNVQADDTTLFVVDVKEVRHPLERAAGTPVDPVEGLPSVSLDDDTGKPAIDVPDADPPASLVSQLLIEGDGAVVEAGQQISVHYTGVVWADGEQFDSSWDRGTPASFAIGTGRVIDGWDQGLVGQKVGSQVLLVIPPELGYGSAGNSSAGIEGTDTLVFVVDILDAY